MEARRTIICKVRKVAYISMVTAAAVLVVLAVSGHLNLASACGIVTGMVCGTANFCLLAANILKISSAAGLNPDTAVRMMRKNYALRMGFMAAFSIAAIVLLKVNPLAHAAMLAVPGFAVRIGHR